MITLSLSPSGQLQAFCEASSPTDRGYYLDLPDDGSDFKRAIYQAALMRQARVNRERPGDFIDVAAIAQWLEANPPAKIGANGKVVKEAASADDIMGMF